MAYPPSDDDLTSAKTTIVNILKMEGYKLDSGSLFLAFKDAGGEMSQFAPSLEELQEEKTTNLVFKRNMQSWCLCREYGLRWDGIHRIRVSCALMEWHP